MEPRTRRGLLPLLLWRRGQWRGGRFNCHRSWKDSSIPNQHRDHDSLFAIFYFLSAWLLTTCAWLFLVHGKPPFLLKSTHSHDELASWSLDLGTSLDVGCWNLEFLAPTVHGKTLIQVPTLKPCHRVRFRICGWNLKLPHRLCRYDATHTPSPRLRFSPRDNIRRGPR